MGARFVKLLARLRDALRLPDPNNPAGGFVRPVYHLKTGAAYVLRSRPGVTDERRAAVQATLAPERFVPAGSSGVPLGGVHVLSPLVEEHWSPVIAPIDSDDIRVIVAAAAGGLRIAGYRVTQHARSQFCDCADARFTAGKHGLEHVLCNRPMRSRATAEIREHVLALQMQTQDIYDGYYPTIAGTDRFDDKVATGGTRIRGGRAEYTRVLRRKNYEHWDAGWQRDTDRIRSEQQAKRDANYAIVTERADKALPRKLGEV